MPYEYNKKLKANSQDLRRNMTVEEKRLWYDYLKHLPITVNRQKIIGNYIVDFYVHASKIVIEVDGIQHEAEENKEADRKRDEYLNSLGITVLRYPNRAIHEDFNYVCEDISKHLNH